MLNECFLKVDIAFVCNTDDAYFRLLIDIVEYPTRNFIIKTSCRYYSCPKVLDY